MSVLDSTAVDTAFDLIKKFASPSWQYKMETILKTLLTTGGKLASGALTLASAVISGGSAGDHTVTGITTSDALLVVLYITGAGSDVTDIADLTSEFTIDSLNTINNDGGTDTSGGKLWVQYHNV